MRMTGSRWNERAARLAAALLAPLWIVTADLPAAHAQSRADAVDPDPAPPTIEGANRLAQADQYAEAAIVYERILAAEPGNGEAWYGLGYCRLLLEDHAAAAAAYEKAVELRFGGGYALYNLTCAYALGGRQDDALGSLEQAIQAGFDNYPQIKADPDLASLRDDPRFVALTTPPPYEPHPNARPVEFETDDHLVVSAELYPARSDVAAVASSSAGIDRSKPFLLLLHQAGTNGAEYQTIAPRLNEMGFHCLAVDARGGGWAYGRENRTVERYLAMSGRPGERDQAMHEFAAAVRYVRSEGFTGKLSVWGSSYSSSLLFQLIAEHPDELTAGLSFSPGPGMAAPGADGEPSWAERVTAPIFVTWPPHEADEVRRAAFEAIASEQKILFVQERGTHGSSTLNRDRNPDGAEENWGPVTAFLDRYCR